MAIEPLKKMRRPRFTDTEILTLVEEVYSRAAVILGKLDSKITADRKTKAWGEVAASVNAVGRAVRTADELRKKFKDLRTHVKSKAAAEQRHVAGTGGGPPAEVTYSDAELIILRMLSPTAFAGLPGPDSEGETFRVSGPVLGPQPSTSTGDGVIPASSSVAGSAGDFGFVAGASAGKPHPSISAFVSPGAAAVLGSISAAEEQLLLPATPAAMGESSALLTADREVTFQVIRHTDDVIQCSQDPAPQPSVLLNAEDPPQPSAAPQPSPAPAPQQRRSRSHSRTPAGFGPELELVPQFLENQQEMRDLLKELVQVQHQQAQAQRELVESHQQSAQMQRELLNLLTGLMAHATEWFKANTKQ